jgi:rubrerythrin
METIATKEPAEVAQVERCLRCSAPMEWRHQTWQCPVCRFKLGCCEGQDCS